MFLEKSELTVKYKDQEEWKIRGGHRLWHTPEKHPRNYVPDDVPVEWEIIKNGVRVTQVMEDWTQIRKDMEITLDDNSTEVRVEHKLMNKNAWPIKMGAWAMSVMAPGGMLVVPQAKKDTGVECNHMLSLWPFSDMSDARVF